MEFVGFLCLGLESDVLSDGWLHLHGVRSPGSYFVNSAAVSVRIADVCTRHPHIPHLGLQAYDRRGYTFSIQQSTILLIAVKY